MNAIASSLPSAPSDQPVPLMDPVAVDRWWAMRRAGGAWLHDEVGRRMAQRIGWIKQPPEHWLDWDPVHGGLLAHAAARDACTAAKSWVRTPAHRAAVRAASPSGRLQRLLALGAPSVLPADRPVDMVWANMVLHQVHRPEPLMAAWNRHLKVGGFLMMSCLGPDSLTEVTSAYRNWRGLPAHHPFTDMHDWGDLLVQAGFAEPVMDVERLTLTYASLDVLLRDLRLAGRNLHSERDAVTRGRGWLAQWRQVLGEALPKNEDGHWCVTAEIIYGHAFKPVPRIRVASQSTISVDAMRAMLRTRPTNEKR